MTANLLDQSGPQGFRGLPCGYATGTAARPCRRGGRWPPDIAKPLKGLGSGILELALRHRGDAFRVVYAVQLDGDIWVIHAFQKKSKSGIKTQIGRASCRERV